MKEIEVKYIGPVVVLTGKFRETISTGGETVGDVVEQLSAKYEGFREFFVNPENSGMVNAKGMIFLRRKGQAPAASGDLTRKIKDSDTLAFW